MPEPEVLSEAVTDEVKDKAIEVDLDKPDAKPADGTSSEVKYVTVEELEKIRKQLNGLSYIGRQFQEVSRKLDNLQVQPQTKVNADGTRDPVDELVEKDWKQAVRTLAREEAESLHRAKLQEDYQKQVEQKRVSILEESKQKVLAKYPEIEDQNSEISKRYMKILNKNQDYLRNDRGPILAMRDLEDEFRDEGRLDEISKRAVEKEVTRQVRTAAAILPKASSGSTHSNRIMLTGEQRKVCDTLGIRYEDYASILKKQQVSGRQGVEV